MREQFCWFFFLRHKAPVRKLFIIFAVNCLIALQPKTVMIGNAYTRATERAWYDLLLIFMPLYL